MSVYTCNSFEGHYPVGTAAVVVAENKEDAASYLNLMLIDRGMPSSVQPEQMEKLEDREGQVYILCDGDY